MAAARSDSEDRAAEPLAELYRSYAPDLWRTAVLLSGDRADADDLVVEAFTRALPKLESGRVANPRGYLRVVLVNLIRARRRRAALGRLLALRQPRPAEWVADRSDDVVGSARLLAALGQLPEGQRAVVVLRYIDDLSERDTASALGVSAGTVKSWASRALAALRTALGEEATDG